MSFASCIQRKLFLVSIIGPSGAGKSQLAKATARELGEDLAARVPTDWFFVSRDPVEPLSAFFSRPFAYDWNLLRNRLSQPIGTVTSTPDADFDAFIRRGDMGGLEFRICPVMICDAMVPYPASDLIVRLDVPDDIRCRRIAERDIRWGTRVRDREAHLAATWAEAKAITLDAAMDGTLPLAENASVLAGVIRQATIE